MITTRAVQRSEVLLFSVLFVCDFVCLSVFVFVPMFVFNKTIPEPLKIYHHEIFRVSSQGQRAAKFKNDYCGVCGSVVI